MDDLLKDAIADAKAVRETALANAKIALEEAFTPRIQSMLSDKIQSEVDGEEDHDEAMGIADEEEGEEVPAPEADIAVEPEVGEPEVGDEEMGVDDEHNQVMMLMKRWSQKLVMKKWNLKLKV